MTKDGALSLEQTLRLALEALEVANSLVDDYYLPKEKALMPEIDQAITAIEARLSPQNELEAHWNEVRASYGARQAALEAQTRSVVKDEPVQKPVAWMYEVNHAHTCLDLFEPPDDAYDEGTLYPLYTTPPQRTWVRLTDEDLSVCDEDGVILARYWEAKLKEKNGYA